jgi:hypothetical protein
MGQTETGQLPPDFWCTPAVAAALATCDFATLLEEVRRAHGWTQRQLALAVGYSQSWVSNVLRRQQTLTIDQAREISHRVGYLFTCSDSVIREVTTRRSAGTSAGPWRWHSSPCLSGRQ